jgi:hypothetical protein
MRGAPHTGFSRDMVRITARTSEATGGRPLRRRLLQVQNRWKPWRCRANTVAGFTMTSAVRQLLHEHDSDAQSHRSVFARFSRRGRDRCNTCS